MDGWRSASGRRATQVHRCEVAVVGGGLAGLVTARRLAAAGRDVLLLEARERVGGRALDGWVSGETRASLGAQWLGPGQTRLAALCAELGLTTRGVYAAGDHLLCVGGRRRRVAAAEWGGASLPLADGPEAAAAWRELQALGEELDLEAPYLHPRAAELDATSLAAWLDARVSDPEHRRYLAAEVRGFVASEPSEVSLLHAAFYLASGGGHASLAGTSGGAQDSVLARGAQALANALAAALGDRCRLGEAVRSVEQGATGVTVRTPRLTVRADRVVVAVPPPVAARIGFSPSLPAARARLHERLRLGAVVKFAVVYPRPFWRDDGLSGQVFSTRGPVNTVYDDSPPGATAGVLVGFFEGVHAKRFGGARSWARREEALAQLAAFFGPQARVHVAYLDKDWSRDPWARGGYGARFAPGQWTAFGAALREPVGRVHWAGSETSPVWNGYMEGAVRSGERAADEVLAAVGARQAVRTGARAVPVAAA